MIDGNGFTETSTIWTDYEYPYRFRLKDLNVFREPFEFLGSTAHKEIRDRFGKGWGYKFLFTPGKIPNDIVQKILAELP